LVARWLQIRYLGILTSKEMLMTFDNVERNLTRPARALVGWMPPEQAMQLLAAASVPAEVAAATIAAAHAVAAERTAPLATGSTVRPIGPQLDQYVEDLHRRPEAGPYLSEGWELRLVDLGEVRAFQAVVFLDHLPDVCSGDDSVGLAKITLPTRNPVKLPVSFDEASRTLAVQAANPNLRIVGNFVGPLNGQDGPTGVGFIVDVATSYVQVALWQGCALLRDGYHRAFALLRAGIRVVPALVKPFDTLAGIANACPGSIPIEVVTSNSGPTLLDYHDDSVAAVVNLPGQRRTLVIQGLELNLVA
jgi:hypothetical protein